VLLVSEELDELDGVELDEDDGVLLLEPLAADGVELELDGVLLDEDEDDPPLALSFFVFRSIEVDEELEPDGAVLGAAVVPLADEDEEPGAVVAPDGEVVDEELVERSAPRSHAVISVAPSARETATAIVDNLMWPPWLGYWKAVANIEPRLLNHHRFNVSAAPVLWSVLCRRLRVVRLEVALLRAVLGIDLPLRRVRSFALLAGRRRPGAGRCRRRPRGHLWHSRRGVGFRRRRSSRVAIASGGKYRRDGKG